MEQYDVTCPICGTLNKGLFLDETGGLRSTLPRRPYKCPRVPQEARRKSDGRIRHAFVCLLSKV